MPKSFKKIALSFLASVVFLFSLSNFLVASAAPITVPGGLKTPTPSTGTWYNQSFPDWFSKVYDETVSPGSEIFGERYTAAQVQWVIYGLMAYAINAPLGNTPESQKLVSCVLSAGGSVDACKDALKGLISSVPQTPTVAVNHKEDKNLWQLVFATDRPLSGIGYVHNKIQNFSLVPVAHAQTLGYGFKALQIVQDMWKGSRDIAFGLFVIAAIAFSFMIMFRVKLSPQTVISVQSVIPKMVISLVLVTFSYAIAGFMVDLMYVVIGLLSLMSTNFLPAKADSIFNFMTLGQIFGFNIQFGVFGLMAMYLILFALAFFVLMFLQAMSIATAISAAIVTFGLVFLAAATGPVFIIIGIVVFIIILIIALWNMAKVMWALFKAFANVLLLVIFAPLQIAAGVIVPSLGFGQWLKSLASNLSVFVVTGFLIFLSYLFLLQAFLGGIFESFNTGKTLIQMFFGTTVASWVFDSNVWPPLLGMGDEWTGFVFLGVSFVLFTLTPKATEIIQGLMSGKPFAYGTAIGEAFGGVGMAYKQSGAGDYVGAIQSIRQSRMWNDILNSRPGQQLTRTLIGGEAESNEVQKQNVINAMAQNKRGH